MKYANYYERTTEARNMIVDRLSKDKKVLYYDLLNAVLFRTGLGKHFLNEMLDLLEKTGHIKRENDIIKWSMMEAK